MIIKDCQCELCCEGELPGVESHLLSEFIIKEAINKRSKANASGNGSKGHELLFTIMPTRGVGLYFRGSATEESKKYLNKNEFTDEELPALSKMINPLTDKYLVCAKCEDLFKPVEDDFKIIYDKLMSHIKGKVEGITKFNLSKNEKVLSELFLLTNLWRFSKSKNTTWKLEDEFEQCLTEIMYDTYIGKNTGDLYNDFINSRSKFDCLDMIVFFDEEINLVPQNPNNNFIFGYYSSDPYLVVANRLVIFISPSNFNLVGTPKICQGAIDSLVDYVKGAKESIYYLQTGKIGIINKKSAIEQIDVYIKTIKINFVMYFEEELKRTPSDTEIKLYMDQALFYIGEQYKYGESESGLIELMEKEILKYK